MLRKWKETPGIKWKNEITPVMPETAKTDQPSKSKGKPFWRRRKNKKPTEPVKMPPEVPTLQEYINSLEEYEQRCSAPVTLDDFIPEEVQRVLLGAENVEEIEDINDAIEEFTEIQPEHCHRITVLNGSEEDVEEPFIKREAFVHREDLYPRV